MYHVNVSLIFVLYIEIYIDVMQLEKLDAIT